MEWTITIPAHLVEAIDKRISIGEAEDIDARRTFWLTEQCLPNELAHELRSIKDGQSEQLVIKLAALPEAKRTEIETLIGESLPTPKEVVVEEEEEAVVPSKGK